MGQQLSLNPKPPTGEAGFSLIELLVVIAVLAILSVGATLSVSRGGDPSKDAADMTRFQTSFATLRAMAIQGRETRGLVVQGEGMRRARPGEDGWVLTQSVQPWRGKVAFAKQGEAFEPGGPDIRFLANGRTSVFSIGFAAGGRCESDGWTGLTCEGG
ncbi:MAG: Tfp pilus assembly protein FimT/FimU [Roseovarius sp.]